jgi:alpha-beta hydrolase superfamily lysophospholipase
LAQVTIPVYVGANIAMKELQPVIFSHGLHGARLSYSGMFMELASCGYIVFTLDHDDGSSIYSEKCGVFKTDAKAFDFEVRSLQVQVRENEILALADEIKDKDFGRSLSIEWTKVRLTDDLILMGHSFGGITAMGAVADCIHASAVIAFDPWYLPKLGVTFGSSDKKSLLVFSETFRQDCLERDATMDLVVES